MKGRGVFGVGVAAVLIAAAIFTGCGSDNGTSAGATDQSSDSTGASSASGPLTKAEFIKQADHICRQGVEKKEEAVLSLAKLATESQKPPSPAALEKVATVVVFPTYNDILDQLSQLGAPRGEEATVEKMIQKYEADLETAEAEPLKAAKENLFVEANDAGEAYGLKSCHF